MAPGELPLEPADANAKVNDDGTRLAPEEEEGANEGEGAKDEEEDGSGV